VVGRHAERDARLADLALRADEPLRHRRLWNEERPGDLIRRQPAERAQRQRHLCFRRKCRMAAREDQAQPFVGDHVVLRLAFVERFEQLGLRQEGLVAADSVDCTVPSRRHHPGAGVDGGAVARPALERGRKGLLHRVLG
jgi:hypothetical protein